MLAAYSTFQESQGRSQNWSRWPLSGCIHIGFKPRFSVTVLGDVERRMAPGSVVTSGSLSGPRTLRFTVSVTRSRCRANDPPEVPRERQDDECNVLFLRFEQGLWTILRLRPTEGLEVRPGTSRREGVHAPVTAHDPVTVAQGSPHDADDRLGQRRRPERSVEPGVAEVEDTAVRADEPVALSVR